MQTTHTHAHTYTRIPTAGQVQVYWKPCQYTNCFTIVHDKHNTNNKYKDTTWIKQIINCTIHSSILIYYPSYTRTYTHVHDCHIHICIHTYIHTYMYIYTYIHTHIHTYIHTNRHTRLRAHAHTH
jgi:hypothetical protein